MPKLNINRRKALLGFGATVLIGLTAPAIVRASSLMKVVPLKPARRRYLTVIADGNGYHIVYDSDRSIVLDLKNGDTHRRIELPRNDIGKNLDDWNW